jgi:hypothetical protein
MQGVNEPALTYCPYCGLEVKRVISSANFRFAKTVTPEKAAQRGMTMFKRTDKDRWEKMGGEGPSIIERSANPDVERIEATSDQAMLTDED